MTRRIAAAVILLLPLAACQKNPPRVDLGVNLYLHPEAAGANDAILQAAIRKKIVDALAPNAGLVHVRVIDGIVFLSGSVVSDQDKQRALEIAKSIDIRVDSQPIVAKDLRSDRLVVAP